MKKLIASLLLFVLLTPASIREYLSHSRSITEWDLRVEQIKRENNGRLPEFWDREIIKSQYADGLIKAIIYLTQQEGRPYDSGRIQR